jgi:hypothetical protein
MKTSLWIQGKSVHEEDIISENGQRVPSKEDCQNIYDRLVNKDMFTLLIKEDNLEFYHRKEGKQFLIYSNFKETDEVGRRIAYMALIEGAENCKEAIDKLIADVHHYGYTLRSDDERKMRECKIPDSKYLVVVVLFIVIIFLILWIKK